MKRRITRTFDEFFVHVKKLGFDPTVCFDVGAASGTPSIYSAFPKALHIAFEPLEDFQKQLKKSLKSYRHEIHECALMDVEGEKKILRQNNLYTSSLMHRREDDDEKLRTIPTKRLDDIMEGRELTGDILIKTDCQGSDLFALKGGVKTLEKTSLVIVETSLFKFWGPKHPAFFEIVTYMHEQGFVVYDILEGIFRPSDNALGQIDLVFAKEKGRLRQSYAW